MRGEHGSYDAMPDSKTQRRSLAIRDDIVKENFLSDLSNGDGELKGLISLGETQTKVKAKVPQSQINTYLQHMTEIENPSGV